MIHLELQREELYVLIHTLTIFRLCTEYFLRNFHTESAGYVYCRQI